MLRRVGETVDSKDAVVKIKDASFPTPFVSALDVHDLFIGTFDRLYARRKLDYDLHHATEI